MELPSMLADAPPSVGAIRGLSALPKMFLLWIVPKRIGPSLAKASWPAAVLAFLIAVGLGLGLLAFELLTTYPVTAGRPGFIIVKFSLPQAELTASEMVRAPFVAIVTVIHTTTGLSTTATTTLLILLAVPVALLALAVLMMPLAAAGERLGLLFQRCLRLTLWSTSTLIPLGVVSLCWPWFLDYLGLQGPATEVITLGSTSGPDERQRFTVYALILFVLWWLFVLWRSGLRYAGPADGPAWRPMTPRCARCGYIIAMLRLDARCPECNHPIADSVAHLRRKASFTHWRAFRASLGDAFRFGQQP